MWTQFLLENAHFAINIFAALVTFAVFWLYVDAWRARHVSKELPRIIGYFLLSLSFIFHALYLETAVVSATPIFGMFSPELLVSFTRIPAYLFIVLSLLIDPLEPHPNTRRVSIHALVLPAALVTTMEVSHVAYPILAAVIGFLYLRRATVGLEDHLKPVALSFFILSLSELFALRVLFLDSTVVRIYQLAAPFTAIWIVEHILLLAASVCLGRWVFGYLLKQFTTQFFMIITTITIAIFLLTTVTFTGLLVRSVQDETLLQLETNVQVLAYTLESKKAEIVSDTQVAAQNSQIIAGVRDDVRSVLADNAQDLLLTKKASSVLILASSGQVLARGEDRDRVGGSQSDNPLVKRALLGETVVSIVTKEGVVSPQLYLEAATPIRDQSNIIGVVLTGSAIDSAYVDGIKSATGLESTIYGDNRISATTLSTAGGDARLVGVRMDRLDIKKMVLSEGKRYTGPVTLANVAYFGAFMPLSDVDNNPLGMLFVGKPQLSVLQTASRSIELTFLATVVLIGLSIVPAMWISKYIVDQIA
jgi:hypothetical protein